MAKEIAAFIKLQIKGGAGLKKLPHLLSCR